MLCCAAWTRTTWIRVVGHGKKVKEPMQEQNETNKERRSPFVSEEGLV